MYNTKGYTLLELILAVAILAILSAIFISVIGKAIARAKDAATLGNLGTLRASIAMYYANNEGTYPRFPPPLNQPAGYGSLLRDALVPIYISEIPQAITSNGYHHASNRVGLFWNFTGNADDEANGYGEGWEYDANPYDISGTGGFPGWGSIRVLCKHKDYKGRAWSTY